MKTNLFLFFILSILIYSCKNEKKVQTQLQVQPSKQLQVTIDSLININKKDYTFFELYVDKASQLRCDMIFHMGKEPYYDNDVLSTCYFLSGEQKINIYSGEESFFNLPQKNVRYRDSGNIDKTENDQVFIMHLYEDYIVDVYSAKDVNPYLGFPTSLKGWGTMEPIVK